jgi:nucleoside-diphosphate-sugar epimerase
MDFFTSDSQFDIQHAKVVMDWSPTISLEEGVRRTMLAYDCDEGQPVR